jgi:oxygen-independent coproporphyrinogen III oxidase
VAGIYVHIPFCKQACHYCNFHFTTSLSRKNEMVAALLREIQLQQSYLENEVVETVYLGGGTPSLLEMEDCKTLIEEIRSSFSVSERVEITLEANPDDITEQKLRGWKDAGINRLSIGIQSFFEDDLQWMNRAHNAEQSHTCIKLSQEHGFSNFSIDLIYGTPLLDDEKWRQNVNAAISYGIPHLSCYALTVEPKTPLSKLIQLHKSEDIDPVKQSHQFLLLIQYMEESGYEHYEISNFAKPGFRSKHNSSYWQGKKYLGIGPSAHSFNGISRQWNVANNAVYLKSISDNILPIEKEDLTTIQQLNEYIMTSLRTMEGSDLNYIEKKWGKEATIAMRSAAIKFISAGKITTENNLLRLTKEGKLFADGIAAELFFL